jgi:hypothetical protein
VLDVSIFICHASRSSSIWWSQRAWADNGSPSKIVNVLVLLAAKLKLLVVR